ncbi:hypothetical protein [Novacetimonas hansenii]|uniref:hypothetical protein n=1 Tax=Novacetimonas hansenii TaxID=436 RepID=UPI00094F6D92|nr:hypothetical protein [Novacetimonas hansenii]
MMIFTSDAAEPVEIPDARQPLGWPIWLLQATALAEREGAHELNDPQTEALRLAWDQGESPQDAVTRVIGADYVQF